LNVEWRDLPEEGWVSIPDTVWPRVKEVWVRALQLGSGGSENEFPPGLADRIRTDGWPVAITDTKDPRFA
jgi:maleylpyruvate isomerase